MLEPGAVRLLRTLGNLESALACVKAGGADGLHLAGPNALTMLESLRTGLAADEIAMTGRQRFSLPHPVHPYSQGSHV